MGATAALLAAAAALAGPAPCTTGSGATPDLTRAFATALASERKRFVATLPAADAAAAGRTFATGVAAYLYGYPDLLVRATVARYPRNRVIGIAALASPPIRTIVSPNRDTLYTVGQLDLAGGPLVVETPPSQGRYSVLQLLDTFTNAFSYLDADAGERVVLLPPGWTGTVPAGLRAVRSPSRLVWLLGRTLADERPAELAAAQAVQRGYAVTPLAAYTAGLRTAALVLPDFPAGGRDPLVVPTGTAFFDTLSAALADDPPPARDACAISAFRAAGVGAGLTPSAAAGVRGRALSAAAGAAPRVLARIVASVRASATGQSTGWTLTPRNTARFGTDYLTRALIARVGLGANTVAQALYPSTARDSAGRPLDGRHAYRVRFAPGRLPPVRAFWSLTLYDAALALSANPLGRYAIGDRTAGLRRDRDGGLTLLISHARPAGAAAANWLPAPAARFSLTLRLYRPRTAASSGSWQPPAVVRTG